MPYDAIIILSGGVSDDGSIPINAERRVLLGADRYKAGDAPIVILTGAWGYTLDVPPKITESRAMKQYALRFGIPEEAILIEEESHDTVGNAYFAKVRILEPKNLRRILVITSDYHTARSEFLFKKILGPEYSLNMLGAISEVEMREERDARESRSLSLAHKWLDPITDGDNVAIYDLLFTKHPGYAKNPQVSKQDLKKKLAKESQQ